MSSAHTVEQLTQTRVLLAQTHTVADTEANDRATGAANLDGLVVDVAPVLLSCVRLRVAFKIFSCYTIGVAMVALVMLLSFVLPNNVLFQMIFFMLENLHNVYLFGFSPEKIILCFFNLQDSIEEKSH